MKILKSNSPNFSISRQKNRKIKFIIIHYTGMQSTIESLKRLKNKKSRVSSHYLISREGSVYQLVEDRKIANLNISVDRANAVAEVLMRHGVPADQLEIIAMSDKEPIAHEYMPSGERENQRTEIYIEY